MLVKVWGFLCLRPTLLLLVLAHHPPVSITLLLMKVAALFNDLFMRTRDQFLSLHSFVPVTWCCVCAHRGHVLTARQPTCDCLTGGHPTLEKVELPRLQHCSMQHAVCRTPVPSCSTAALCQPDIEIYTAWQLNRSLQPIIFNLLGKQVPPNFWREWQFCANLYFKTWIGSKLHTLVPLNVKSNVIVSPSNFALSCHHGLFNDQWNCFPGKWSMGDWMEYSGGSEISVRHHISGQTIQQMLRSFGRSSPIQRTSLTSFWTLECCKCFLFNFLACFSQDGWLFEALTGWCWWYSPSDSDLLIAPHEARARAGHDDPPHWCECKSV